MVVLNGTSPSAHMFRAREIPELGEWRRRMRLDGYLWDEGQISMQGDKDLIRLLAHRFGSLHIMRSARFSFGC